MNKLFTCDCGWKMIYNEPNMREIKQKHYGQLEVDSRERDIIIITMVEKTETNLIQIERENLPELIKILQSELSAK